MKGLLKNNFIGVIENLKLLFPLAIIFGIIVSITGNASLLSIYSLSITPILLLLVVLCMRKETLSKWDKYKISLPVRRNDIVKSYYTIHLCWCIGGMAIVTFFMFLTVIIHGNQYFLLWLSRCGYTYFRRWYLGDFYWFHFFILLYYFLVVEKIEITAIISLVVSVAVIVGISLLIKCIHWWKCVWYDILYKFNSNCNYYLLHFCMFLFFISIYFSCKRVLVLWLRAKVIYRGVYDKT
mgnify:CR=1 FL=1